VNNINSDELKMPFGKFKGQPIDLRTRRSVFIKRETDQFFEMDYFFHQGRYHRVRVPKNSVKKIVGMRFNFSVHEDTSDVKKLSFKNPFINHAMVRFLLEKPIEFVETGENISDLVYSVEVVGPKGKQWSLALSFGDFISAHRMLSTEEVVFERAVLGNYKIIQSPPLLLDQKKLNAALDLVIRRSHQAGLKEKYFIVNLKFGASNCTSEPFELLDSLISKDYSGIQKLGSKIFWRFPINLRRYLRVRGVIDPSVETFTLNEEFAELIKSSKMRDRREKLKK